MALCRRQQRRVALITGVCILSLLLSGCASSRVTPPARLAATAATATATITAPTPTLPSGFRLSGDTTLNPVAPYFYAVRPAAHRIGAPEQWRDASGVRIFYVNGTAYNHPAIQAQDGLWALGDYYATSNPASLALAEKEGQRLIATHQLINGAWWEPYRYPFALYGDPHDVDEPPWYSGLTQGQVLDLFSRLYALTHAPRWAAAARGVFASFLAPQRAHAPWVSRVDSRGYLWLEEYPTPHADDDTVNGLMFAALGLASYDLVFQDARALRLFDGALATTLYALSLIRRPGRMMLYSLLRRTPAGPFHAIVVALCRNLAELTSDQRFSVWARRFQADYPTTYP